MSTQLLFYREAVPVSKETHANLSIDTTQNYDFAGGVNSVPLTATEFPFAARDYVIVFAGPETPMPAAILGVQQDKNLFVAEDGHWEGRYIPAFVRRYPFVFSSSEDASTFTLCVDKEFQGLNEEGRGERLFSEEGENSAYLERMLNFLQEYQVQFQRTQAFCQQLKDLDLLETMQAHISMPSGSQQSLTGFKVINRERLKALDGDKLAELAKTDALELAYLHLQSLNNFSVMVERAGAGSVGSN
ncbi:MAG: SapC family protein [Gammaproteobacteria bacterium]|nr:SapC family protein [Gammaproteobacteria bacterium]MDH3536234.1 SapC family protein [Gammaproteobacteria bacterium]